ncbi:MAG: YggS family pyridoxal phosphate-dependent enzyme [Firmicutes bacterium]|nr:YggS family pyridoxal phosphate-dependent enzyme [Alicyclobacillaceae bacterium]MCL6497749.1 YggS family pyridoxal phosphate-dependent enzyme [Bacillota bacterium]
MSLALIQDRVAAILERLRALRPDGGVRLMVAAKGQSREAVEAALAAGAHLVGENRVQEARAKWSEKPHQELHLIGHLQTNKARAAVELFDAIDSVDSDRIAQALDQRLARPLPVMVEVNAGREAAKTGLWPEAVAPFLAGAGRYLHLQFVGLMAMLPAPRDQSLAEAERIRRLMQETAELWRTCRAEGWPWAPLAELSMGMSSDWEWAVEAGATMIRIGTGIFGPRRE